MNNKTIATLQTYDPNSLTSTGYDVTLYADGSISLEYRSRWQGSRDGTRYRSDPEAVDLANINDSTLLSPHFIAAAKLCQWVDGFNQYEDLPSDYAEGRYGFRMTRRGRIVG